MGKNERLVDLLQNEIKQMDDKQVSNFRNELKKQLPEFIRKTAQDAKKAEGVKHE